MKTMNRLRLNIDRHVPANFDFPLRGTASVVIRRTLREEGCPFSAEISLLLTGDEEIRLLNNTHRGMDRATDVLSFPAARFCVPADFSSLGDEKEMLSEGIWDPDAGSLLLGDIVISVPRVREQAMQYGHSEKREFSFLIAHSVLHLLGYDHESKEEAAVMEQKQEKILADLGIMRESD